MRHRPCCSGALLGRWVVFVSVLLSACGGLFERRAMAEELGLGEPAWTLPPAPEKKTPISFGAISANGNYLVADAPDVRIWNRKSRSFRRPEPNGGLVLAVTNDGRIVTMTDIVSHGVSLERTRDRFSFVLSPDGSWLVQREFDEVVVRRLPAWEIAFTIRRPSPINERWSRVNSVSISPDSQTLVVSFEPDGDGMAIVETYSLSTSRRAASAEVGMQRAGRTIHSDSGARLAIFGWNPIEEHQPGALRGIVELYDGKMLDWMATRRFECFVGTPAFSRDERWLAIPTAELHALDASRKYGIELVEGNAVGKQLRFTYPGMPSCRAVSFSADGTELFVIFEDGAARGWKFTDVLRRAKADRHD